MTADRRDADAASALERRWSRHDDGAQDAGAVRAPDAPAHPGLGAASATIAVLDVDPRASLSDQALRDALATLVLTRSDAELRRAQEALVGAFAVAGTTLGRIARLEGRARAAGRRLGLAGRVAGVALAMAAVIGTVGAPVWLVATDGETLRDDLGACALVAGLSALVVASTVLATGEAGRERGGALRALAPLELAAGLVSLMLWAATFAIVVLRAGELQAFSPAVAAGLLLQCLAGVVGVCAVVVAVAPQLLGRSAAEPSLGVVLATPSVRLRALAARFDDSIRSLDAAEGRELVEAMRAWTARLIERGILSTRAWDAVARIDVRRLRLDAHLAARCALAPDAPVVLRPSLPIGAVTAVLDGGAHGGRLVRRIVQAVSGRRSRRHVPWEAGMLVDLVAAARVPVLEDDAPLPIVRAYGRTVLLVVASSAIAAATWALGAWRAVAADATDVAAPAATLALLGLAAALVAAADVLERAGGVRSAPTTTAWAILALAAGAASGVVAAATPYSAYLVQARAPWAVALAALAVAAAPPCVVRLAARLRGRPHDAVQWTSASWPMTRASVDAHEARRRARIAAASAAHVDALVERVAPAIALAVDVGLLEPRVLASLPHPARHAAPAECAPTAAGSPSR
ncbi:hypothetical protein C1N71_08650 [Agrococcus sp. SGAir0287]|nr:hypothetical protein C1N71_08650 [Agrococcus sp. SGAir0287]